MCSPISHTVTIILNVNVFPQRLKKYALDEEQILDTGKFRYLDEHLPEMKERVSFVDLFPFSK